MYIFFILYCSHNKNFYPIIIKLFFILNVFIFPFFKKDRCGRDHMVVGFTTTYMYICMQSVSITTDVVSLNVDQGEVHNIL